MLYMKLELTLEVENLKIDGKSLFETIDEAMKRAIVEVTMAATERGEKR